MIAGIAVLLAFALDWFLGDPPTTLHPVRAMGSWIGFFSNRALRIAPEKKLGRFLAGTAAVLTGAAFFAAVMLLAEQRLTLFPAAVKIILYALLLKPMFTLRGLLRAGAEIRGALEKGDLVEARRLTGWHLVSRDTSRLSESEIASAVIESLAENLTDSFFAPLLFFAIGGLPAAWVYRFINTADAMIGYRNEKWEWIGKTGARLDDLLNYFPARLCALALCVSAAACGAEPMEGWNLLRSDHGKTESPNAGWTMAAAAGILDVRLTKPGCYILNERGREPLQNDIQTTIHLTGTAAAFLAFLLLLCKIIFVLIFKYIYDSFHI